MTSKRILKSATVDGTEIRVGDHISFKSDIEQSAKIIEIFVQFDDHTQFLVEAPVDGFSGDYIGGARTTMLYASDCWVE